MSLTTTYGQNDPQNNPDATNINTNSIRSVQYTQAPIFYKQQVSSAADETTSDMHEIRELDIDEEKKFYKSVQKPKQKTN